MGRTGAWVGWTLGVLLLCAGCSNPCSEVAGLLRQCCAKGPAELRQSCDAEAQRLEDNGNSDACEAALDDHRYDGCAK